MLLAAVVIVYNPNLEDFTKNCNKYINSIDHLIIWDNSPGLKIDYRSLFESNIKITYLTTGKNEGIAYALNRSFEWAIENSFDYILAMDQDSCWDNFKEYKTAIGQNLSSDDIYIFAPTIRSNDTKLNCNKSQNIITSGSIFSLELFKVIGYFRESFFIDEVDNEYCIRAEKTGYRPMIFDNIYLDQVFGKLNNNKYFRKYSNNYSAFRLYYQTRNRIWVWQEYHKYLSWRYFLRTVIIQILRRCIMIVINDNCKKEKLFSIYKGIKDGVFKSPDNVSYYKEGNICLK